jgi:dGTPase
MLTRQGWEKRESESLAPYAVKSSESRGRVYPEEEHPYRSIFQRDHDRIIHSTAFRRLEYKTQVFVYHEGDYYRTRLTHTIEVAQISRSIARALSLNEDLCEAIALAHDLGHTPFGHTGEKVLNELMAPHGGFEHNRHGLRVVDRLERRYPDFPGLNLSYEVREGIIKHSSSYDNPSREGFESAGLPTLEAQAVNLADEIAYNCHDLDDGLTARLLTENDLERVALWEEICGPVKEKIQDRERRKYQVIRRIINLQVSDLVYESARRLEDSRVKTPQEAAGMDKPLVSFSGDMSRKNDELKNFLFENMYSHYRVVRMLYKAERFIKQLFDVYLQGPEQLPPRVQERMKDEKPEVVVCDYIAGMTDKFALDEYKKLFEPYEKV